MSEINYLPRKGRRGPPQTAGYRIDAGSGCWLWTGAKDRKGYGLGSRGGKFRRAHRMVWEVLVGSIPEGYDLHHRCGNHGCVNPEHLEARPPRAHRGPKPKLDDQTLNTVLAMVLEGYTLADIAAELDVDYTTISTIRLGALFRRL